MKKLISLLLLCIATSSVAQQLKTETMAAFLGLEYKNDRPVGGVVKSMVSSSSE